jgi:hypothetical protein
MQFARSYAWPSWKDWIMRSVEFKDRSDLNPHTNLVHDEDSAIIRLCLEIPGTQSSRHGRFEQPRPISDDLENDFRDLIPDLPDYSEYLTDIEAKEIMEQFDKVFLRPGCQVMWTGVPRDWAQEWANCHGLQTLSTAMGPLMETNHTACRKRIMSSKQWSNYVRGASLLFAGCLPKGHMITVLTMPPPVRFNPTGQSTYQELEEPVLKGRQGGGSVLKIEIVHLTVIGLEDVRYQLWPSDEVGDWIRISKAFLPLGQHRRLSSGTWTQRTTIMQMLICVSGPDLEAEDTNSVRKLSLLQGSKGDASPIFYTRYQNAS